MSSPEISISNSPPEAREFSSALAAVEAEHENKVPLLYRQAVVVSNLYREAIGHIDQQIENGQWPLTASHNTILTSVSLNGDAATAKLLAKSVSARTGFQGLGAKDYVDYIKWHQVEAAFFLLGIHSQVISSQLAEPGDLFHGLLERINYKHALFDQYLQRGRGAQKAEVDPLEVAQRLKEGDVASVLQSYVEFLSTQKIESNPELLVSWNDFDVCPLGVAARVSQLSSPQISRLVANQVLQGIKPPGSRIVYVSLSELQDYISQPKFKGRGGDVPKVINGEDGNEYWLASTASQLDDIQLHSRWLTQLVNKGTVRGFKSDGPGKRVYVDIQDLRKYLAERTIGRPPHSNTESS